MPLDKKFWIESLWDIHGLTFTENAKFDWSSWAKSILRKAANDEVTFKQIVAELAPPERWSEELCLDRLFHLLHDGEVQADDSFQKKVFFLLSRIAERGQ